MTAKSAPNGLVPALVGSGILGLISTFGDWLWTHYIPDGAVIPGVLHGVIIFLVLAVVLAASTGQRGEQRRSAFKLLLIALPIAGGVIAASFYPMAYVLGYLGSLLVTWVAMWLVVSWLNQKARGNVESFKISALRAALAAVGAGLAFWAISGIWTQPSPGGPNYLWHFVAWTFAFSPGFLALFLYQPEYW